MSNDIPQEAVRASAILILKERINEHKREADVYATYAVYGTATPPRDDAPDAVKVVEKAVNDSCTARALFHKQERKRFEAALAAIEGAV